jgi:large subunit ribosomal protein L23
MATTKKTVAKKSTKVVEAKAHKKSVDGVKPSLAHVLVKPWITEKAAYAADKSVYTFLVDPKATKGQIRDAIHALYGVNAVKIATTTIKPEVRLMSGRITTARGYKKAMVYLPKGSTIDFI